jgi:hypothetical protein
MGKYKNIFIGVCFGFVITSLLIAFSTTSYGKNAIGFLLGKGTCPNCHDSWYWKEYGDIYYEPLKTPSNFVSDGFILDVKIGSGVMLCKECLSKPKTLNTDTITKSLKKYGWDEDKIYKVILAVNQYKAKREYE